MTKNLNLEQLFEIVKTKIETKESGSYCNEIAQKGVEKITRKIGEEATEVIIASFIDEKKSDQNSHQELVGEICDLFFHNMILMAERGISFDEILQEFNKRNKK